MSEYYAAQKLHPPPIARLRTLIEGEPIATLRSELPTIWADLLRYHEIEHLRVNDAVTLGFSKINALAKKG